MFENNEHNEFNEYTPVSHYCNEEPEIITTEQTQFEPANPSPKKDKNTSFIVWMTVICILCSAVFGVGGAYITNKLMNNDECETLVQEETNKEVYV